MTALRKKLLTASSALLLCLVPKPAFAVKPAAFNVPPRDLIGSLRAQPILVVGDFNGDGNPDVMLGGLNATGGTELLVYLGNGKGVFAPQPIVSKANANAIQAAVIDVNHDGKLDVVTANGSLIDLDGSNTVSVQLGNGDGTFQAPVNYPAGRSPVFVAVADLNGDGNPDILAADYNGKAVSVLFSHGDGTFSAPPALRSMAFQPASPWAI